MLVVSPEALYASKLKLKRVCRDMLLAFHRRYLRDSARLFTLLQDSPSFMLMKICMYIAVAVAVTAVDFRTL